MSSATSAKKPGVQGASARCVWESEDRLEAIMMGMRRNDREVRGSQRKCSSDSSSSADSGNGKTEEIKEEPDEEDEQDDQFEKLQGAFKHQEMQRMTEYQGGSDTLKLVTN
jgi:hypothetical protein